MRLTRLTCRLGASLVVVASMLSGCGGSSGGGSGGGGGGGGGPSGVAVTGVAPTALVGCAPTPLTITGTGFNSVSGTTMRVVFRALGGATPFAGGSADTATATGLVTSGTTLAVIVPALTLCGGPASVTLAIDVFLESGVAASGSGAISVTVSGPTLASVSASTVPAAIPTAIVVTGAGFGPVGGPVTLRLVADGGATIFKDGTKPFADIQGIVTSATTVSGTTPIATVCGAPSAGCALQLLFPDGCCTPVSANGLLTFLAPTLTSLSQATVPAAVSVPGLVLTGTGFGANGAVARVRFVADGGAALFLDGTAPTVDVPGVVGAGGTTITCATPLAAVCGAASASAAVHVLTPYGSSCVASAPGVLTFTAPTITGAATGSPLPGAVPTLIDVPGADLGPVGAPTWVRLVADGGDLIFQDGTAATIDVPAVVFNASTVRFTTPRVTVCGAASRTAGLRVFAPYGGACVDSGAGYLQFDGPTLAAGGFSPNPIASTQAASFTLTGTNFGPVGSPVKVRFVADAGTPFGNASLAEVAVAGVVASTTQITGRAPTVAFCGVSASAAVVVTLSDGSCVASAPGYVSWSGPTITAPTAGSPLAIPSSAPPASITINGTGFAPVGGSAGVVFVSDPSEPPLFGDGTSFESAPMAGVILSSTAIQVRPPHATVCGGASRLASLRVELANGSCATTAAQAVRFDGPTVLAIAAVPAGPFLSGTPTPFQITGTGFGPVGSEAIVRFVATSGAPFANGTSVEFSVAGAVTSPGTIVGTTPLVALCGASSVSASFRVTLQDGSCADSAASAITWTGPTVTNVGGVSPFAVPSAVPTLVTVNGAGFGPVGARVDVVFVSDPSGPALFGDGTSIESAPVEGTIVSTTQITVRTPHATVCEATSRLASLRLRLPGGSCAVSGLGALRFEAPTLSSLAAVPAGPFVASVPTGFQVNGANLGSVTAAPATVRFVAATGTPFSNGTSAFLDVPGLVNAAGTQITGTTPVLALCGTGTVTGSVRVTLQDGTCVDSGPSFFTFVSPSVTNVNGSVPAVLPASTPNTVTVNGTGFGPVGGFAEVVFVSDPAPEPPLFADGTQRESAPVLGLITSATTISVLPPHATVSNAGSRFASVRVRLPGGSCAASPAQLVRFDAPTIASIAPAPGPAFDAALSTAFTLVGTGFGPPGSEALVRFVADGGATPFGNGTLREFTVAGLVNAAGTQITGVAPLAGLCPGASVGASLRVMLQDGTSVSTAPGFLTFVAPAVGGFSPSTFDGASPSPGTFTLTGTGFGPVGALVHVRFAATGGARPFGGGTLADVIVLGQVVSPTSVTGTLPLATVCGAASVTATATVHLPGGACASTGAGAITMTGPTLAAGSALAPSSVPSTVSTALTITGTGFGPVGQPAFVTLAATSGAPFGNGTLVETTVTGTIVSPTTITAFTPLAAVCTGSATATVVVRLPNGSCTPSAGAPTLTFAGPTITSTSPTAVASAGLTPTTFTLNGTGFAPLGPVTVRFSSSDAIFGDGTAFTTEVVGTVVSPTAITVPTPLARVCTTTSVATATARVLFSNGSCADAPGTVVTFNGPIPLSVTGLPPIPALNPGPVPISGTNYPPIGTPVDVVFTAVAGTPFAGGTAREARVVGFVNPLGQITVVPPLADVCPPLASLAASIQLDFGSSRCLTPVPGTVTFRAPVFTPLAVSTPANAPASFTITGIDFPVVGTQVIVGFSDTANPGTAFDNASQKRTAVAGVVSALNTVTVPNPPRPAACPADVVSTVDVNFGSFSCVYPVGGTVTFLAPVLSTVSQPTIPTLTPASLVLTGNHFGPTGVEVVVRWQSGDLVFSDGNEAAVDLPGTVTSNTTIATVAPLARVCPGATSTATIRVIFPPGSCADSPAAFVTFPGPTFAPNTPTVAALDPGSLTLTGTNFPPVGTPVTARLVVTGSPNQARIFASGTASEAFAYGTVGPAGSATLALPVGAICPPDASVAVEARVTFASGSCPEATAATLTYLAPTITSIGAVTRDATEPAALTINGTNFPPVGTQVAVRFTADAAYPQLFGNAGLTQTAVGTVTAATSITVRPPAAAVCEAASAAATLDVAFASDPCFYAVPGTFTYQGPAITGVAPATLTSLTPAAVTITGLRFGPTVPAGSEVTVRWTSADPIFGDGTLTSVDLPGTIVSTTSITTNAPVARVCAGGTSTAAVRVIFPMGACATTGAGAVAGGFTFVGPVVTALAATVDALNPGSVSVVGTNFPPVGTPVSVTLSAPAGQRPFASGTQAQATVVGAVGPADTLTVTLPVGDVPLAASPMTMTVGLDIGNSTCPSAAAGTIDYVSPSITTIGAPVLRDATAPAALSIAGTAFPAVGATAEVRFTSTLPIFGNASLTQTVVGTVTGAGTLSVAPPAAAVCELATADATLEVRFLGNSLFYAVPGLLRYQAPAVTGVAPASIAAMTPQALTISGLRFGPTVPPTTQVTVRWTSSDPIFGDGTLSSVDLPGTVTSATTITTTSPLARVCAGTTSTATFRLIFAMGACAESGATDVTFSGPSVAAALAASVNALDPGTVSVTLSNAPPVGTPVGVTLSAAGDARIFAAGTQHQAQVTGVVAAGGTVSIPLPIADLCTPGSSNVVAVGLDIGNSTCPSTAAGTVTYDAPTFTSIGALSASAFATPAAIVVSGTNLPADGSPVEVRFLAAGGATPFAGGTQAEAQVTGVVSGGGTTITVVPPTATLCDGASVASTLQIVLRSGPCAYPVGGTLTYAGPTLASLAPTTVDALAPTSITLTGTNLPPGATVTVVFTAATGTPFEAGTSASAETTGVVNAGGTSVAVSSVPGASACQVAATITASVGVLLADGCLVTPAAATLTYTLPTIASIAPSALRGRVTTGGVVITGANFGAVPVNTAVRVRFASNANVFADGTSTLFETTGFVLGGSTISTEVPDATICGSASVQASITVVFADGTCAGATNLLTYHAPQVAGAGLAGFVPQNLAYEGETPFTVLATAGNNDFAGFVGQTVDVHLSVASGTPFRGGTSDFDVVPGVVTSATTIAGAAPRVLAASNTIPGVSVRVRFEDGSCTDLATTTYFRADNLLAVSGSDGLTLIATSGSDPYGAGANTVVSGTPVAGAAAPPGGMAVAPLLNKAFGVDGSNLVVVDLGGPAATSAAGAPTLGAAAISATVGLGAAGLGVAYDPGAQRVFVLTASDVVVVDARTHEVLASVSHFGASVTGALLADLPRARLLIPDPGTGAVIPFATDTLLPGSALPLADVGTAAWTGGLAIAPAAGLAFATYDDPAVANNDVVQALDLATLSTAVWTALLAAGDDPSAVIGVDPTSSLVLFARTGPNDVAQRATADGAASGTFAVPDATQIVGPGSTSSRAYVSSAANNSVAVLDPAGASVVTTVAGVNGAAALFATSP